MAAPSPYLLDTNVVLSAVRRNDLGLYLIATYALADPTVRHEVSIVTVGELRSLSGRHGWGPTKRAALDMWLSAFRVRDIDNQFVPAYAEIDLASHALGRKMGKNDLWIAATARELGLPLLTTDADFDHLHPAWITLERVDPASKLTP